MFNCFKLHLEENPTSLIWLPNLKSLDLCLEIQLVLFFLSTLTLFSVPETRCSGVSCSVVQLFATPWTVAYKAPVSMGLSRQEYCSGLPFRSLQDLPDPGNEPGHTALQADSLPSELQGSGNMLFSSVQSLSRVQHFATQWTAAHQVSLSIFNSWSLLKLMSITLVMTSNHLILCYPLLLRLKYFPASGSFPISQFFASGGQSLSISSSNEYSGLISFRMDRFNFLRDSQGSSPTSKFKSINYSVFSFL